MAAIWRRLLSLPAKGADVDRAEMPSGKHSLAGCDNLEPMINPGGIPVKPPMHIEGGYRRVRLTIGLTDGANVDAWVYFAEKSSNDSELRLQAISNRGGSRARTPCRLHCRVRRIRRCRGPRSEKGSSKALPDMWHPIVESAIVLPLGFAVCKLRYRHFHCVEGRASKDRDLRMRQAL